MKLLQNRIFLIVCISLLAAALIAGGVIYFGFIRPKQRQEAELLRQVQEYRDKKMEQYQKENAEFDDFQVDVAFLGDSLTDGYDLEKFYPQYLTMNRGIAGDTTFTLEERLQVSVYDLQPKVAVLLIGANNMDTMFQNYEDILIGFRENLPESEIILLSLTAMGGEHWGRKNQLAAYNNVTIKLLAEKYGYTYIDLYSPLYDVSTGEVFDGYTSDGGHLTADGYTLVTTQITPVLQTLLGR